MLRKTKHNRASMKRSETNELSLFPPENSDNFNNNYANDSCVIIQNKSNVVYQKTNRKDVAPSVDFRPSSAHSYNNRDLNENARVSISTTPIPNERKMSLPSWMDKNDSLDSIGTYVKEEIGPGIILEGYAVEI